jgi:hypothetical protein
MASNSTSGKCSAGNRHVWKPEYRFCKPTMPKWRLMIERLKEKFPLFDQEST